MAKLELEVGENELGNWTLLYMSPDGGKYNGKLLVTNKRLLYDAKFDVSAKGLLKESLFLKIGSVDYFVIPKSQIKNVEVKKSFFSKKVLLTLDDGKVHTFSYGMLSIDKVVDAIKTKA